MHSTEVVTAELRSMTPAQWQAPAEIYTGRTRRGPIRVPPLQYRRFATLAEAVRYSVEYHAGLAIEATIYSDDLVVTGALIQALYQSSSYPLTRSDKWRP